MNDLSFWRDRSVLITGHTGFKGSWLVWWLSQVGSRVSGISLPGEQDQRSLFTAARLSDLVEDHRMDIRDANAVTRTISQIAPEIVIHMAAQSLVRQSYIDPVGTYDTNIMGTVHVLEAIRATSTVRAVVVVTSDKCYAVSGAAEPFSETSPLGGRDPYSSSKAAVELIVSSYRHILRDDGRDLNTIVSTARSGNVIGGGDWAPDRLIPDLVRAKQEGDNIKVRYPNAIRPWQHVLEPLHGYLLLAKRQFEGDQSMAGAWNFGPAPTMDLTVLEVVKHVQQRWGGVPKFTIDDTGQPAETAVLKLDSSKALERLQWRQLWSQPKALNRTADWYEKVGDIPGVDEVRSACTADIELYVADLSS